MCVCVCVCVFVKYYSLKLTPQCCNIHLVIDSFHTLPVRLLMRVIHVCTSSDFEKATIEHIDLKASRFLEA